MNTKMSRRSLLGAMGAVSAAASIGSLTACGGGGDSGGGGGEGKGTIELWFWGAPPQHRATFDSALMEAYNAKQDAVELMLTYNEKVDSNIQTALAAGEGPDVVYGSGPAFVTPFAQSGKLLDLSPYVEKYGWKDRMLGAIYEAGTVDGKLYAVANSINTIGIFYNKKVLASLGVEVPTTLAELEEVLTKAKDAGLYPSVTGNKGWQPVNENYSSMFLTAVAGPQAMYDVLTGAAKWTDKPYVDAVKMSAEWYENGFLGGGQYPNLNFTESMQLLADQKSPFMFGPTLAFQFATDYFNEEAGTVDDLGFTNFPTVGEGLASPLYTVGTTASFSINANTKYPDQGAEVIDMMLSADFGAAMTETWPGYWAVPVKDLNLNNGKMTGLSKAYADAMDTVVPAIDEGRFGYFSGTFYPPQTQQKLIDIDTVWLGTAEAEPFMAEVEEIFAEELADGAVPPIPQP